MVSSPPFPPGRLPTEGLPKEATTAPPPSLHLQGPPQGVSGSESEGPAEQWATPPDSPTPEQLDEAEGLSLAWVPASEAARALVEALTGQVADWEATHTDRKTKRRKVGMTKLRGAVGAVIGGVLRSWARSTPRLTYRSRKAETFSGSPVARAQFVAAVDGLRAPGMLGVKEGIRFIQRDYGADFGRVTGGRAGRYWPTASLLALATERGITPATVKDAFDQVIPTKPPKVAQPVVVRSLKVKGQGDPVAMPVSVLGPDLARITAEVEAANAFAAEHQVQGCLPPRWQRLFLASRQLHGRWYAAGSEGVYQRMSKEQRAAITINGEPVAEVDIHASQLSIAHGLLGLTLPDGDLYEIAGLPRSVVKQWIVATLGLGKPVRRWAAKTLRKSPEIAAHDPRDVGRRIVAKYPFLAAPAEALRGPLGLDQLAHLGTPQKLLTHRLAAVEADALTGVMMVLRPPMGNVLALPVHDGLIVPESALRSIRGDFDVAFGHFAKVRVRLKVTQQGRTCSL